MEDPSFYYLYCVLPFVIGLAGATFAFGAFLGWLFWGHYPKKARAVSRQNEAIRREIRRLTA